MNSELLAVTALDNVFVAQSGKLSCIVLRLLDDTLCIYSPVAGLEKTFQERTKDLGQVTALLAPNHFHNKGLASHIEAFPHALLYSSATAALHLSKVTGLKFDSLDGLSKALPEGKTLHEPDGLKTGEVWMQINSVTDCALVVTDAFCSENRPLGEYAKEVTMLNTFPRYGVKRVDAYKAWSTKFLSMVSPTILLPCHGSPVKSQNLTAQLLNRLHDLT